MNVDDVRKALRARHAGIEPDAHFAHRVVARLPQQEGWTIEWAARRILPVAIALAAVLMVAAVATYRSAGPTVASMSMPSIESGRTSDALDWLLEGIEARR
jgi:hypothetical protein